MMHAKNSSVKRTRRGRQRGAVAVEGMIVMVMMTVVVMGTWFTRQVFSGKLLTVVGARADAWKDALKGCDDTSALGGVYQQLHDQSKDPSQKICTDPNDCSTGNSSVDGLNNDGSTTPSWFPNDTGNKGTKSLAVAVDAAYSTTVSTTIDFACNPKPHNELDLAGGLVDAVNQILKIPDEEVTPSPVAQRCMHQWVVGQPWKEESCSQWAFDGCANAHVACPDPRHLYYQRWDVDLNGTKLP
jgi:hypothetical protein